jgi:4-diphosphocytidyl-2-C-methyl-D-erythritol kinase
MVFLRKKEEMIAFPVCKINIGLHIIARRADGYHDIETIFYPVGLCDAIEFIAADDQYGQDELIVTGIDSLGDLEDNIIIKTIRRLRDFFNIPVLKLHLHKSVPPGAGLGGGSSDAAYLLKALNRFFDLDIPRDRMMEILLELGSDCPFFIDAVPSYATGRGEIMVPVAGRLSGFYLTLLNPGVSISTAEAYRNCRPAIPGVSLSESFNNPPDKWTNLIVNDFEDFAIRKHPVIGEIKDGLYSYGALFSLMSGSGSSIYGIFRETPQLPDRLKKYVIWEGIMQ